MVSTQLLRLMFYFISKIGLIFFTKSIFMQERETTCLGNFGAKLRVAVMTSVAINKKQI